MTSEYLAECKAGGGREWDWRFSGPQPRYGDVAQTLTGRDNAPLPSMYGSAAARGKHFFALNE